jgi:hypothetical protein
MTIKPRRARKPDRRKEIYGLIGIILLVCLASVLGLIISLHVDR